MTDEIDLTVPFHTRIRVERQDRDAEIGLVTVDAKSAGPPLHQHEGQDEHWTCVEGQLSLQCGKEKKTLSAGEVHIVPRGTPHTYWNDGAAPCVFRYELNPGSRFTSMMRTFAMLAREGRLRGTSDIRSIMHMAQVFIDFGDHVRAVAPPHRVMRAMAATGRTLGLVSRIEPQ